MLKTLWLKLRALVARGTVERELDDEVRFHIDMETEANLRKGMEPEEARRQALVAFGGVERFKEEAREARGTGWIEDAARDGRVAVRSLARAPAFAAAALLTLGLGVGATTAVWSVVRGVVLRPLPFPASERLVTVWLNNPPQGIDEDVTSWPNFRDWRDQSEAVRPMVALRTPRWALTGEGGDPEEVRVGVVSEGFFEMMGAPLALGRGFRPGENEDGGARVAVLSHGVWTRRFGADPGVLGRTVRLNDEAYEVVGVAAPGRGYPRDADAWVPFGFAEGSQGMREARGALWLSVVGRLADGVELGEAQAEMDAIADRLARDYPETNQGTGIVLEPLRETLVGDVRTPMLVLLGAVAFILLIVVANVAGLLLARGAARGREMALRLALGAGRGRVVRQVLVESVALAALGGVVGLGLAFLGVRGLVALSPADLPRMDEVGVDPGVLLFALGVAALAGVLFGAVPAIQAGRADPGAGMAGGGRGVVGDGGRRLRGGFVAGEFAVAVVLLVGAGLLLRSFANLRAVDPGFEAEGVLSLGVSLPGARYPDAASVRAFQDRVLEEMEALPGVTDAALVSTLLLSRLPNMGGITLESRPDLAGSRLERPVVYDAASPSLFRTLGMAMVQGRTFDGSERVDDPTVAVVNETFVRTFLPDRDPVGERFAFGTVSEESDWIRIVGVVADARRSGPEAPVRPESYIPHHQFASARADLLLRSDGDPVALAAAARRVVNGIDPALPVTRVRTLENALAEGLAGRRFVLLLLVVFAGAATLLAAVGIYGVMAYVVGRRRREIGIRVALGADRRTVLGSVLREGMGQAVAGLVVGLGASLLLTRYLRGQLFGLEPTDPLTFAGVAVLLVAAAALGTWLPARRAAGVDPVEALREE